MLRLMVLLKKPSSIMGTNKGVANPYTSCLLFAFFILLAWIPDFMVPLVAITPIFFSVFSFENFFYHRVNYIDYGNAFPYKILYSFVSKRRRCIASYNNHFAMIIEQKLRYTYRIVFNGIGRLGLRMADGRYPQNK